MKQRLSVSVDAELVEEGKAAVAAGLHDSISSWVSVALRRQSAHDSRLQAADEFFRWYEAEHGEITEEDMDRSEREMGARAIVVNGGSDEPATDTPRDSPRRSA